MKPSKDLIGVRLEQQVLDRIDELRPVVSTEWHKASRSDVLRGILHSMLDDLDRDPMRIRELLSSGGAMGPSEEALAAWRSERKKKQRATKK